MIVLFSISFLFAYLGVFLIKKSENKANGAIWLIVSAISVVCMNQILVGIIALIHVPVTLLLTSIVYLAMAGVLWFIIIKKNYKQLYYWDKWDLVCFAFLVILCVGIGLHTYGRTLAFLFRNSDPAVHFGNAMNVVRHHKLSGMWFAALFDATIIENCKLFLSETKYYKAFILADQLVFVAQALMFYSLIREFLSNKRRKVIGMMITVLFLMGYPMVNYYMGFHYWGMAVTLIAYILYLLGELRKKEMSRQTSALFLMYGSASLFLCYMLFAPIVYIVTLISIMFIFKEQGKLVTKKNIGYAFAVFLLPCILGLYYCYFQWFGTSSMTVSNVAATEGGMYRELYINFLLLIPFVLYWIINRIIERKCNELVIFTVGLVVFILVLLCLVYKGRVSTYYFYKLYYPLWMLVFVVLVPAVFELFERQKTMLISMVCVIASLAVLYFGKIEQKICEHTILTTWNHSAQFFDVYYFMYQYMLGYGVSYSPELLGICEYVLEELDDGAQVPMVADMNTYGYAYWYDSITGKSSYEYYGWCYPIEEIAERVENEDCDYIVVMRDTDIYWQNYDFWESYPTVMENGCAKVFKVHE